ncbi:unnamed protein product [Rhizoctonia solani]|uniref:Uncharacterized protein n=1 Tax=Rhizoctonia solani TaxID=456999 RepID=A0A8H3AVZ8_9AGAM|nr:unnamed protein product [Rhizoctonia solani]
MSDLSYSPEPVSASSRKRKSADSGTAKVTKKPRGKKSPPDPYETAKGHVESVLASPASFDLPEDEEEIREMITTIVRYTKSLQESVSVASLTGGDAPPLKTPEQIQAEVTVLKGLIKRGIEKLMCWKPTCKEGRTKFAFEGVCSDPRVFGTVFGSNGPPNWRTKKYTYPEFEDFVGNVRGQVRYSYLVITSNLHRVYKAASSRFNAGCYIKRRSSRKRDIPPLANNHPDLLYPPEPISASSRKRKSAGSAATQAAKKPRGRGKKPQPDPYETAKGYVDSVLASPESFDLPEDYDEIREMIATMARYTKSLEGSIAVASRTGRDAPLPKTAEQIQTEVSSITNLITRGIKKLMTWKPNCKYGRARYAFDSVCPDPRVFGTIFGLNGPPPWKAKKYTYTEFENFVGEVKGRARYSYLVLTSDVNIRYNPETGEFKVSGSYGDAQSRPSLRRTIMHAPMNIDGGSVEEYNSE